MARQRHGDGSVFQRKDGRYVVQIVLENGRKKQYYFKQEKEALAARRKLLYEKERGMLATGPQQTLKVYLDRWVEEVYKPTVKPLSYQQYRSLIKNHLVPGLGNVSLQKLTPEKIQALYTQKLAEGYAPKTVALIHTVLHRALENAVRWNLVSRNVAKLVTLPHVERHESRTLTVEQARRLLEVARGSYIETLLLLAVTTGMRRGELLALRWEDVDFENGVVSIRRTMNRITGYGPVETEPKTKSSRRMIVLPGRVLKALKVHREQQNQERIKAGSEWHEQGLVFCNRYGGFMIPQYVGKVFHKLLAKASLPDMRFHDLRHSMATVLLAAGVHPKIVQERLGHSTIAMTMDIYSHVLPSMQQDVARRLDEMFGDE
jgi:integrase